MLFEALEYVIALFQLLEFWRVLQTQLLQLKHPSKDIFNLTQCCKHLAPCFFLLLELLNTPLKVISFSFYFFLLLLLACHEIIN